MVACGRVVGVVAGVEEGRGVEPDGRGDFGVLDELLKWPTRFNLSTAAFIEGLFFFSPSSPVAEPPHTFAERAARILS